MPLPKSFGTFCFDAAKGIASVDENQKLIWGFEKEKVTFREVLSRVEHNERDRFIESIDSKIQCTKTHNISLENGNKIKEWYRKFYHQEDYQYASLVKIIGSTELLEVNNCKRLNG